MRPWPHQSASTRDWARTHKLAGLYFSGYYCNESSRMELEKAIRDEYDPPCGEREQLFDQEGSVNYLVKQLQDG